jgi:hypothetical protein
MEREFYSLADASGTIGCSVDDLIHYGASGHLNIIVLTTGLKGMLFDLKNQPVSGNIEIIKDRYCFIDKNAIKKYESYKVNNDNEYGINVVIKFDNSGSYWKIADIDVIPIKDTSLFILAEDITLLRKNNLTQPLSESTDLINTNNSEDNSITKRKDKNELRDEDAALWLDETKLNIELMTLKQIETALQVRDVNQKYKLWSHGFKNWHRKQQVFPKKISGRPSKQIKIIPS